MIEGRTVFGQSGPRHVLYGASRSLRRWTTPYLRGTAILSGVVTLLTNRLISSKAGSSDCESESLSSITKSRLSVDTAGVPSETWDRAVGDRWAWRSPRSFPTGLAVGGFQTARVVEKHHALVSGSEGFGELAGAGSRSSSSAGGGRPGNGGSPVDLFRFFWNPVRIGRSPAATGQRYRGDTSSVSVFTA